MDITAPPPSSSVVTMAGMQLIERIRGEEFNLETERKLEYHPFVLAAEAGTLSLAQRRAFCYEQYAIQRSDAISFASLAGHSGFRPDSLTHATAPNAPPNKHNDDTTTTNTQQQDLFHFLLCGEIHASSLLLKHASMLGIHDEQSLAEYSQTRSNCLAQAYPSYWARLALDGNRAAGAAACAINFPAWGRMCQRLYDAEVANAAAAAAAAASDATPTADEPPPEGMDFIKFFATPIENLDEMAAAVIDNEEAVKYDTLVYHIRMLQEYEVLFWDAVYDGKD
jgi:hypothetical protein